ncbi:hypothetical protein OAL49_08215 [Gammaproteobacteria bacterium]|nr:hypothetical protein [Gammaproteobacteria bacterium]
MFILACASTPLVANIDFLSASLAELDSKETRIAAEYTYFDESLDVLDYGSKIESRSKPESADTVNFSISNRFFDRAVVSYQYETTTGRVTRDGEPFELESQIDGHRIESEIFLGRERCERISIRDGCGEGSDAFMVSAVIGLGMREQEKLEIDCIEDQGVILGGGCDSADFRLLDGDHFLETGERLYYPALTSLAEEQRAYIGLNFRTLILDKIQLNQSLRLQRSKIETGTTSRLFDITDPFLLNTVYHGLSLGLVVDDLKAELPQVTPWYENAFRYEIAGSMPFTDSLFGSLALAFYKVDRPDYEPNPEREDFDNNIVLNASLWYTTPSLAVYFRAQASNHYLLGIEPISYNRKTNKFFGHPYGHISAGIVVSI